MSVHIGQKAEREVRARCTQQPSLHSSLSGVQVCKCVSNPNADPGQQTACRPRRQKATCAHVRGHLLVDVHEAFFLERVRVARRVPKRVFLDLLRVAANRVGRRRAAPDRLGGLADGPERMIAVADDAHLEWGVLCVAPEKNKACQREKTHTHYQKRRERGNGWPERNN